MQSNGQTKPRREWLIVQSLPVFIDIGHGVDCLVEKIDFEAIEATSIGLALLCLKFAPVGTPGVRRAQINDHTHLEPTPS